MARGLTVKANPGKEKMTGGLSLNQLSEQIRELKSQIPIKISIDAIPIMEVFENLFPMKVANRKAIGDSIRAKDFDRKKAVLIGVFPDGSRSLVDGFTRRAGSLDAGKTEIYAWEQEFESVEAAIDWAMHEQIDRRNLSESELYDYVLKIDEKTGKGYQADGYSGKSSKRTADIIGTSARKVEQIRTIEKDASHQQKEEIRSGKKSVNKAYKELKAEQKAQRCASEEKPERNWEVKTYIGKVSLIRNDEEVVLVNYTTLETLYGAPAEKIRKVVEQYLEKIL